MRSKRFINDDDDDGYIGLNNSRNRSRDRNRDRDRSFYAFIPSNENSRFGKSDVGGFPGSDNFRFGKPVSNNLLGAGLPNSRFGRPETGNGRTPAGNSRIIGDALISFEELERKLRGDDRVVSINRKKI